MNAVYAEEGHLRFNATHGWREINLMPQLLNQAAHSTFTVAGEDPQKVVRDAGFACFLKAGVPLKCQEHAVILEGPRFQGNPNVPKRLQTIKIQIPAKDQAVLSKYKVLGEAIRLRILKATRDLIQPLADALACEGVAIQPTTNSAPPLTSLIPTLRSGLADPNRTQRRDDRQGNAAPSSSST